MKKTTFSLLAVFAVATGLAAAWSVAPLLHTHSSDPDAMGAMWADSYRGLEPMARDVDAVVLATVEATRPGRIVPTASGTALPFTLVDLRVERAVRGDVESMITVEQTGGELDGRTLYIDGDGGPYTRGEQVLLFLKRQPDADAYYLVHPQGRFSVDAGRLRAVTPEDPVAQQLDLQPVDEAIGVIASVR